MFVLLVTPYAILPAPTFYYSHTFACAYFPMAKHLPGQVIPPTIGTIPLIGRPQAYRIPPHTLS